MNLCFKVLHPMDYVLTTDISLFAGLARWNNVGIGNFFNTKIATHAGCLVDVPGLEGQHRYFMLEMLPPNLWNTDNALKISSLSTYTENGKLGKRIVSIMRNPIYDDRRIRDRANDRAITDAQVCLDYDTPGVVEYVWPRVEDRPDKFYCSELLQRYAILDGSKIESDMRGDDISPFGIQRAKNLIMVDGWVQ